MASHLPFIATITLFLFLSLSLTPSHSATTCASPKLPSNRTFANCTALSALGATLHYSYNATNRSLAVAFAAAPPSAAGWIAWGLNLGGFGMVGAQALVAIPADGAVAVHRYNLSSYKDVSEVKAFSFDSWNVSAEQTNGVITIYASVKIPETAPNVSHVWQVGPVSGGKPQIHAFKPENINSKAALPFAVEAAAATGNATGNATAPASGEKGASAGERLHFGWVLAFIMGLLVAF